MYYTMDVISVLFQPLLPVRRAHRPQPVQHVRGLPQDAGGHHQGHTKAGHPPLLQVLREVRLDLPIRIGAFC